MTGQLCASPRSSFQARRSGLWEPPQLGQGWGTFSPYLAVKGDTCLFPEYCTATLGSLASQSAWSQLMRLGLIEFVSS